jgi:hypothetical protein
MRAEGHLAQKELLMMGVVVPSSGGGVAATIKKMLRSHRSWSRRGGQKCLTTPSAPFKGAFGDIF